MSSDAAKLDLLTVEDYRATPEGARYQLVEGALIMAPSPNRSHQTIVWNLNVIFGRYLEENPVGKAFAAPFDVYLSVHDVVQPDILYVANAHIERLAEDGLHGAPDLVIEVLSPATAQLDRKHKRRIYAQAGVKELWLVDPILLQIHLYDFARDQSKPVRIVDEDETFETALLPGLIVAAEQVFRS